jgi:predicted amidohydrolase
MKVTLIQPPYPINHEAEMELQWQLDAIAAIPPGGTDLIALQENSNVTGVSGVEESIRHIQGAGADYCRQLVEHARRIGCAILAGIKSWDGTHFHNQVALITPGGEVTYPYSKNHLVALEHRDKVLQGERADVFEYNGIRFGAAICFDFYFTELFQHYARQRADVIFISSHQRQEPGDNLEFLTRARAFDSGCTVIRVAPAMPDSSIGGRSMVVAPDGRILANAGGMPCVLTCEFEPHARFVRPASYNEKNRVGDYREVIQNACRPELYNQQ